MADEEALLVVVGVDEPAGDALRTIGADFAGIRMEDIQAVDPDLNLTAVCFENLDVGLAETTKRLPLPVFSRSSAMWRSAFMRALRRGMRPSPANSDERTS